MAHNVLPSNRLEFLQQFLLITVGTFISIISIVVFFIPANIAPAGVSGIGVILNDLFGVSVGLIVLIGNIPIMFLAYRVLGGWQPVMWTLYVVVIFSAGVDLLSPHISTEGVSKDLLLNAIFAGVVSGIGGGLIYRGGGSAGGTSTLGRILQVRYGLPLSSTYLYVSLGVITLAGIFLGWESALYSLIALFIDGLASDYVLEGPSVIRTAVIITDKPEQVAKEIFVNLQRGATDWEVTGMYTGETRHLLYVSVARSQVTSLRQIVAGIDPHAFVVVGQGHVAYGSGFSKIGKTSTEV